MRSICDVRSKALGVCHARCLQTSLSLGPGGDSSAGVFTYFSSRHLEVGAPSAAQTGFKPMSSNLPPTPSSLLSGTRVQDYVSLALVYYKQPNQQILNYGGETCLLWGLKDPESDLQKPHNNRAGVTLTWGLQ